MECQFLLALWRFTHEGDACSAYEVGAKFYTGGTSLPSLPFLQIHLTISEGTARDCTYRVMVALLDIESRVTFWPEERHRSSFRIGLGSAGRMYRYMDGFHVVLAYRPARVDGSDFYTRKNHYAFNIFGTYDQMRRIRHLTVGNIGKYGDNPIWTSSPHYLEPQQPFGAQQYLLADSAFEPGDHCVPLFKKEQGEAEHGTNEVRQSKCSIIYV